MRQSHTRSLDLSPKGRKDDGKRLRATDAALAIAEGMFDAEPIPHGLRLVVRLTAKTKKARERLRSSGDLWIVIRRSSGVLFKTDAPGPWLFMRAGRDMRWVSEKDDPHFDVEVIGTKPR